MNGEEAARQRLAELLGLGRRQTRDAKLTRLGGLTNRVFKVELDAEALCLRIPGRGSAAITDRRREEHNARAAAAIGVTPEVVRFATDGAMLTRFVTGEIVTPEYLEANPEALARAAAVLRKLHTSSADFAGLFDAFATMDAYVALLERQGAALSKRHRRIVSTAQPVRDALQAHRAELCPCHCDPTGPNLIDTGARVWLLDWEYSAVNDPMWDLAYLSIESSLSEDADRALLDAYLGRPARPTEAARMAVTKVSCALLAGLWALVQEAQGNDVADFRCYAERTFERVDERMEHAAFAVDLKTLHDAGTSAP